MKAREDSVELKKKLFSCVFWNSQVWYNVLTKWIVSKVVSYEKILRCSIIIIRFKTDLFYWESILAYLWAFPGKSRWKLARLLKISNVITSDQIKFDHINETNCFILVLVFFEPTKNDYKKRLIMSTLLIVSDFRSIYRIVWDSNQIPFAECPYICWYKLIFVHIKHSFKLQHMNI